MDYSNIESLQYALRGIDTVISTVTGPNQIELIRAAVSVNVRRFAPAEFEGLPQLRSANNPLDRSRLLARQLLSHYSQRIQSTTFVCGILYERFQPGGLQQSRMGVTSRFASEGDYIMNCRLMQAQVPAYDAVNSPSVRICMTAAQDVGRFVTKAIDLRQWPPELRMVGQRVLVTDLINSVQTMTGEYTDLQTLFRSKLTDCLTTPARTFNPIQYHNPASLRSELQVANAQQDHARAIKLHAHIATAEGHYDFSQPNMNRAFPDIRPIPFREWFVAKWNLQH